jgi:WD40 repeat protein
LSNVCCISFDEGQSQQLFAGTETGLLYVWDTMNNKNTVINGHASARINSIAHEPQQSLLVTAGEDKTVKIWDTRTANSSPILSFDKHNAIVKDVSISPDGRWIASGGNDGIVKIWEMDTGKIVKEIISNSGISPINCLDYNPSTLTIGFGCSDKTVNYWDLENFSCIC